MLTEEEWSRVTGPLEAAWTLPPRAYTSSDIFAEEISRIFYCDWICVARASQLPDPGDYLCVDLVDQPIVITRDSQGALRAMSRICLHRAMPLVADQGNAGRFVCPYHNWTYELDGRLRSAPMMEGAAGFDPAECRLPQLAVEVWQGFVFVNLRPDAPPLAPRLAGLAEQIDGYGFGDLQIAGTLEFDSPWNWKILVENFMEAYHHIGPIGTLSSLSIRHGTPWWRTTAGNPGACYGCPVSNPSNPLLMIPDWMRCHFCPRCPKPSVISCWPARFTPRCCLRARPPAASGTSWNPEAQATCT